MNCAASKSTFLHCLTIALLVTTSLPALAKVRKITLASSRPGKSAIALDAQQRPHISYQSPNYHLYHAWLDRLTKHTEVVDATSDCGWDSAIAVDSQGRVHISYHAEGRNSFRPALGHAVFDGAQWHLTDVAQGGSSTSIALDANERPQILHFGGDGFVLKYSTFDGVAWDTKDTGLSGLYFVPTGLALDAAGTAHITFTQRRGFVPLYDVPIYATNNMGTWAATDLVSSGDGTALALDSLDRPHVAIALTDTIQYSRFDGAQWQNENVFEPPTDVTLLPGAVALALDKNDRPHILFSASIIVAAGGVEVTVYTYFDGVEWRGILVDRNNAGFDVAVAVDTNRVVHGVYRLGRGENRSPLKYAQITLPDLTGAWALLPPEGSVVQAALTVRNQGADTATSARVAFHLSDDAVLDAGDEELPLTHRTGSLRPGVAKTLRVSFQPSGVVSGRYLIAVIDPDKTREDLDRPNNTIAIQL